MMTYAKFRSLADPGTVDAHLHVPTGVVRVFGQFHGVTISCQYDPENPGMYAYGIENGRNSVGVVLALLAQAREQNTEQPISSGQKDPS